MSAQLKALTIQNGVTRRILDASSLEVGLGINSADGQDLTVKAANQVLAVGDGQQLLVTGSTSGATSGNGGLIDIAAGVGLVGSGGALTLRGGNANAGAFFGGDVSIHGGNAYGDPLLSGGGVRIEAGDADTAANIGSVYIGTATPGDPNSKTVFIGNGAGPGDANTVDIHQYATNATADALFLVGAAEMLFNELQQHSIRVASPGTGNGMGISITSASSPDASGGKISLNAGSSSVAGSGATATVHGGSNDVQAGGNAILVGGDGETAGGRARVLGGNGNPGSTATGGVAEVSGGLSGDGATGNGGNVSINGGAVASTNGNGGSITITAQDAAGTGLAGTVSILAGVGGSSSAGGTVFVDGGVGQVGQIGGPVLITGGTTAGTIGGLVTVKGSDTGVTGGAVSLLGGSGTSFGGIATVKAGDADGENTAAATYILGGDNTGNTGGPVYVRGGTGSGANFNGSVNIGTSTTLATNISTTVDGSPTTNIGNGSTNTVKIHSGTAGNAGTFEIDCSTVHFKAGSDYDIRVDDSNVGGNLLITAASAVSGDNGGHQLVLYAGSGSGTGTGGATYIDGGTGATNGNLYLGTDGSGSTYLDSTDGTYLRFGGNDAAQIKADGGLGALTRVIEIDANARLKAAVGGTIDLPSNATRRFQIEDVEVTSANITAANFDALFNGSDVSVVGTSPVGLHTHTAITGSATATVITLTSSESIPVGAPVHVQAGVGTVQRGQATTASGKYSCVGLSQSAAVGAIPVILTGLQTVLQAIFDVASGTLTAGVDEGKTVYVSDTLGLLTTVAPNGLSTSVQKVGVIATVSTGVSASVIVGIGDLTLLPA